MPVNNLDTVKFETVKQAILDAVAKGDYKDIDNIVADKVANLTQTYRSKTPVFAAVEEILGQTREWEARSHAVSMIAAALKHIFSEVDKKLGSDKEVLEQVIHSSCNHISHTSLLDRTGGTIRDLLEKYVEADFSGNWAKKDYPELSKLFKNLGMLTKNEVMKENLQGTSIHKGR